MPKSKKSWLSDLQKQIKNVTDAQLDAVAPKSNLCSGCKVVGAMPRELQALYFIQGQHVLRAKQIQTEIIEAAKQGILDEDIPLSFGEKIDELEHHFEQMNVLAAILKSSLLKAFPDLRDKRYSLKKGWFITYHETIDFGAMIFDFLSFMFSDKKP